VNKANKKKLLYSGAAVVGIIAIALILSYFGVLQSISSMGGTAGANKFYKNDVINLYSVSYGAGTIPCTPAVTRLTANLVIDSVSGTKTASIVLGGSRPTCGQSFTSFTGMLTNSVSLDSSKAGLGQISGSVIGYNSAGQAVVTIPIIPQVYSIVEQDVRRLLNGEHCSYSLACLSGMCSTDKVCSGYATCTQTEIRHLTSSKCACEGHQDSGWCCSGKYYADSCPAPSPTPAVCFNPFSCGYGKNCCQGSTCTKPYDLQQTGICLPNGLPLPSVGASPIVCSHVGQTCNGLSCCSGEGIYCNPNTKVCYVPGAGASPTPTVTPTESVCGIHKGSGACSSSVFRGFPECTWDDTSCALPTLTPEDKALADDLCGKQGLLACPSGVCVTNLELCNSIDGNTTLDGGLGGTEGEASPSPTVNIKTALCSSNSDCPASASCTGGACVNSEGKTVANKAAIAAAAKNAPLLQKFDETTGTYVWDWLQVGAVVGVIVLAGVAGIIYFNKKKKRR
jgi:hypothetical protein